MPPARASAAKAKSGKASAVNDNSNLKVDSVLNRIERNGKRHYLIKWIGQDESEWQPVENLQPQVVTEFEAKIDAGIQKLESVSDSDLPEHLRESGKRPARRSAAQAKAAVAAMPADDEEENEAESEELPSDSDEEYAEAKKKGKRGASARKSGGGARGRKESSEEEDDDSEESGNDSAEEEDDSAAKKRKTTMAAPPSAKSANGSAGQASQPAVNGAVTSSGSGRRGADVPMALPQDTYLIRDADFNFQKNDRPYLKDGIPIWRVDNKHLVQLFQRFKPDDYTVYVRTDMYDAWNYQDATGLHKLEVKSCQRSHGRDSEVTVEIGDEWVSKIKEYERAQGITVVGGMPVPPTPAAAAAAGANSAAAGNSASGGGGGASTAAAQKKPAAKKKNKKDSEESEEESEEEEDESDDE